MRYVCLLFLIGCGEAVQPVPEAKPPIIEVTGDPMECRIDGDGACHCVIPEFSAAAIEAMGNRCNFLRTVDPY